MCIFLIIVHLLVVILVLVLVLVLDMDLVMVLGAISSLVSMGIRTRALVQFVEVVDSFHKFNIVYSVYF